MNDCFCNWARVKGDLAMALKAKWAHLSTSNILFRRYVQIMGSATVAPQLTAATARYTGLYWPFERARLQRPFDAIATKREVSLLLNPQD